MNPKPLSEKEYALAGRMYLENGIRPTIYCEIAKTLGVSESRAAQIISFLRYRGVFLPTRTQLKYLKRGDIEHLIKINVAKKNYR